MARKSGLGRGLDALIPPVDGGKVREPSGGGVNLLPVEHILPNPRQPRSRIDPDELSELADSIREHGLIQPVIVTSGDQEGEYILVAGERRLLAARLANMERIPAIIREATDQQRLELALIENLQRADLNPLESAEAYRQLAEDFNLSHEEIAARAAKSRVTVTNTLRLLKLPPIVQHALLEGKISEGHARTLLGLPTSQAQAAVLQTILTHGLNVRQAEALVRKMSGEKPPPRQKTPPLPEINALEERLRDSLGTRVSLNHRRSGGTIVIHYYSNEELDTLVGRILGDQGTS